MPSSQVMHKFKKGKLHSGSKHGAKVTNPDQAIAIMMSERRAESSHGGHYPEKRPGGLGGPHSEAGEKKAAKKKSFAASLNKKR